MKTINKIVAVLLIIVFLASCNKNYYSGSGKGGKGCGCPSQKGMSGY
jgi:predicted small secreted protein